jgi:DNA-binding NarL/FixJ family response regulator
MKPTTQQQLVHLRLLSKLPVRTHYCRGVQDSGNIHFVKRSQPTEVAERKKRIRELWAQGKKAPEIARIMNCTRMTVHNHLRK